MLTGHHRQPAANVDMSQPLHSFYSNSHNNSTASVAPSRIDHLQDRIKQVQGRLAALNNTVGGDAPARSHPPGSTGTASTQHAAKPNFAAVPPARPSVSPPLPAQEEQAQNSMSMGPAMQAYLSHYGGGGRSAAAVAPPQPPMHAMGPQMQESHHLARIHTHPSFGNTGAVAQPRPSESPVPVPTQAQAPFYTAHVPAPQSGNGTPFGSIPWTGEISRSVSLTSVEDGRGASQPPAPRDVMQPPKPTSYVHPNTRRHRDSNLVEVEMDSSPQSDPPSSKRPATRGQPLGNEGYWDRIERFRQQRGAEGDYNGDGGDEAWQSSCASVTPASSSVSMDSDRHHPHEHDERLRPMSLAEMQAQLRARIAELNGRPADADGSHHPTGQDTGSTGSHRPHHRGHARSADEQSNLENTQRSAAAASDDPRPPTPVRKSSGLPLPSSVASTRRSSERALSPTGSRAAPPGSVRGPTSPTHSSRPLSAASSRNSVSDPHSPLSVHGKSSYRSNTTSDSRSRKGETRPRQGLDDPDAEMIAVTGAEVMAILRLRGTITSSGDTGESLLPPVRCHQMRVTGEEKRQLEELRDALAALDTTALKGSSPTSSRRRTGSVPQRSRSSSVNTPPPTQSTNVSHGRWKL